LADQSVNRLIRDEIRQYSANFADFEQVKQFKLIDREFSQETDEMTPTLKLKRNVILENFADQINEMYG